MVQKSLFWSAQTTLLETLNLSAFYAGFVQGNNLADVARPFSMTYLACWIKCQGYRLFLQEKLIFGGFERGNSQIYSVPNLFSEGVRSVVVKSTVGPPGFHMAVFTGALILLCHKFYPLTEGMVSAHID